MRVQIHDTPSAIGEALAARIANGIEAARGGRYVLGCPGGRSPMPVYEALARLVRNRSLDCSGLVIVMMDEYLVASSDGALTPPPASAHYSCRGFGEREIVGRINAGLQPTCRIAPKNFWMPDVAAPGAYDGRIADAGGVDLFLLASGAGDGHIAFNPPGSARESQSRIVTLAEQTRRDNLATFPDFENLDAVPSHGITIGVGSIASLSKSVAMIVWGEGKRQAFKRINGASAYQPDWPATISVECRDAELHADRQAADA